VIIELTLKSPTVCIPVEFSASAPQWSLPEGGENGDILVKDENEQSKAKWESPKTIAGTKVSVDGQIVSEFPADTYIAQLLADLVNSAPETLDTLAEIAKALGNDPNFATTIMTMLGNKADSREVTEALAGKEDKFVAEVITENLFDPTADPSIDFSNFYGPVESQKTFGDFCPDLVDGDKVIIESSFRWLDDLNGDGTPVNAAVSVGDIYLDRNDRKTATIGKEVKLTDTVHAYSGDDNTPEGWLEMVQNGVDITVTRVREIGLSEYLEDLESRVGTGGGVTEAYIAEKIAALVNSAPATLDTLAEIAKALGNDPNFATTILAELGKKLDAVTTTGEDRAYVVSDTGAQSTAIIATGTRPYSIPRRSATGAVSVGTATTDADAVPLAQMNESLDGKEDKFTAESLGENLFDPTVDPRLSDFYGSVIPGAPFGAFCPSLSIGDKVVIEVKFHNFEDLNGDGVYSEPYIDFGGIKIIGNGSRTVTIGKEVNMADLFMVYGGEDLNPDGFIEKVWNSVDITVRRVNEIGLKEYLKVLDNRIGDIDTALDEVLALQEYYTGATFDQIHEYAEGVIAGGAE
jgi:DNA-binding ferritin-like protein